MFRENSTHNMERIELVISFEKADREHFIRNDRVEYGLPYILKSTVKDGMWSSVKYLREHEVKTGEFKQWLSAGIVYIPSSAMDVVTYSKNLQV